MLAAVCACKHVTIVAVELGVAYIQDKNISR